MAKEEIKQDTKKRISPATIVFLIATFLLLITSLFLGINTAMKSQKISELEYANENLRKDNIDLRTQNEQLLTTSQKPATQPTSQESQIMADYFFFFNDMMQWGTQTGIQIIIIDDTLELLRQTNNTNFTQVDILFSQLSADTAKYKTATQNYLSFFNTNEQTLLKYDKQNIIKESKTVAEEALLNIDNMLQAVDARIQDLKKSFATP